MSWNAASIVIQLSFNAARGSLGPVARLAASSLDVEPNAALDVARVLDHVPDTDLVAGLDHTGQTVRLVDTDQHSAEDTAPAAEDNDSPAAGHNAPIAAARSGSYTPQPY